MPVVAVVGARDRGKHPHLPAVERAIGNGDAQHIGMKLEVEPVHQAKRLELVLGYFARKPAFHLIAKLIDAGIDDRLVILIVFVHVRSPNLRRSDRPASASGLA